MQSNLNKSLQNQTNNSSEKIDELLIANRNFFCQLLCENLKKEEVNTKKNERTYLTVNEIDIIKQIEINLYKLIETCPPYKINELLKELHSDSFTDSH